MISEIKNFILLFKECKCIYEEVMTGLFNDESTRGKTKIAFELEIVQDKVRPSYFIDESLKYVKRNEKEAIFAPCFVKDFNYEHKDKENDVKITIKWMFFRAYYDENGVKIQDKVNGLLYFVLNKLTVCFNELLQEFMEAEGEYEEKANYDAVAQSLLLQAGMNFCRYMEKLYKPLNIQLIDSLSGEYYEKSECESNLIFLPAQFGVKSQKWVFKFTKGINTVPFAFSYIRLLRKLLQISQDKLFLVFQENPEKGIFEAVGICDEDEVNLWSIPYPKACIKRHMQWDMFIGKDTYLFSALNGMLKIKRPLNDKYVIEEIKEVFKVEKINDGLIDIIINSAEQRHGTMLVVLDDDNAEEESRRLCKLQYGLLGEEVHKEVDYINNLNSIDGSAIIGLSGKIYGIGMILDGNNKEVGNLSRGARFNSAQRYRKFLEERGLLGLLLIVSEDGSVEFVRADISK